MTGPLDRTDPEQQEIDADRRAEWWLVLWAGAAIAVVAALVLGGIVLGGTLPPG